MIRARRCPRCLPAAPSPGGRASLSAFVLAPFTVLTFGIGMLLLTPTAAPAPAWSHAPLASAGSISSIFTSQVQYWAPSINRWSTQSGLDPNLLAVVIQIESCGDPGATSSAGARGLFQVMPYHFRTGEDPYAPDTNASRAIAYLQRALATSNNDVRLALAGYNGGIGVISEPDWLWPTETSRYAHWGTGIYTDAESGASSSERLTQWLAAGGSSLCSRADQVLRH